MGKNIRAVYDDALRSARRSHGLQVDGDFFSPAGKQTLAVRTPNPSDDRTTRTVTEIAPRERQLAIDELVRESRRVEEADLRVAFARLFGWRRAGVDIQTAFDRDLAALVKSKRLVRDGDYIIPSPSS